MANSTLFPLPIGERQLKRHFTGLGDVLAAAADYADTTIEQLASTNIRSAVRELERATQMPFFVTRYATREVADQESWTLGEDYDAIIDPQAYIIADWTQGSGRTRVPWRPIVSISLYRLTFASGGQIVDLPLAWLNRNDEKGTISIMPHGIGINATQYYRLLYLFPFYRGSASGTIIEHLIHPVFSAGLVDPTDYDANAQPDASLTTPRATIWDQNLVDGYLGAIGDMAAGTLMEDLASAIHRGGVQVSMPGLSQSVNPEVLFTAAQRKVASAREWAQRTRDNTQGPVFVTI